nr:hypothetical protein [Tanacetum cinerariifolium]
MVLDTPISTGKNLVMGQVKILKRGEPLDESLTVLKDNNDRKVLTRTTTAATTTAVDRKPSRKVTPTKKKPEKEKKVLPNPNISNSTMDELKLDNFALSPTDRGGRKIDKNMDNKGSNLNVLPVKSNVPATENKRIDAGVNEQVFGVTLNEDIGVEQFSYLFGVLARKNSSGKKYNPATEEKLVLLRDNVKPMNTCGDMSCNAGAYYNGEPSKKVVYPVVKNYVKNVWSRFMLVRTMINAKGIFFFKYSSTTGMEAMFEGGPWLISNVSLILCKWTPMTNVSKENLKTVQVWVKPRNVPITGITEEGLRAIARKVGTLLC